jgi:hypothetical protein
MLLRANGKNPKGVIMTESFEDFVELLHGKNKRTMVEQIKLTQEKLQLFADNPSNPAALIAALQAISRLPIAGDIILVSADDNAAIPLSEFYYFDSTHWSETEVENLLYADEDKLNIAISIAKENGNHHE